MHHPRALPQRDPRRLASAPRPPGRSPVPPRAFKCPTRSTLQIRCRRTALRARRSRIRANADYRKALDPPTPESRSLGRRAMALSIGWRSERDHTDNGLPPWPLRIARLDTKKVTALVPRWSHHMVNARLKRAAASSPRGRVLASIVNRSSFPDRRVAPQQA
jgi:hypothetical protein